MFDQVTPLQNIIASMPNYFFCKDINSRYSCCNDAYANFVGLKKPQAIIGMNDYAWRSRDYADVYRADDQITQRGERLLLIEPIVRDDGLHMSVITRKTPVFDVRGNIEGVIGQFKIVSSGFLSESRLIISKQTAMTRSMSSQIMRDNQLQKGLSERESQIVVFLLCGLSAVEIGARLHRSNRTIEKHINSIYRKLGCQNKRALKETFYFDDVIDMVF